MHRCGLFIGAFVGLTGAIASAAAQDTELKTPSPIALLSDVYFEDNFDGDQLADHWQVTNPDIDSYIVEDGALLVIGKEVGGLGNEATPNLFRLTKELPPGDWTITVKMVAEFQTGRDMFQFGLFADPGSFLVTSFWGNGDCCPVYLKLRTQKTSGGQTTQFENVVLKENLAFQEFADTIPQPITLKLIKQGRTYRSAVHFDGQKNDAGEPVWAETDLVSVLRPPKQFVINASQWEPVAGESLFLIDSVTIEAASDSG